MALINCEIDLILTWSEDFWNNYISKKYQPKLSTEAPNQHLDFLIDPCFQRGNKIFALLFENEEDGKYTQDVMQK